MTAVITTTLRKTTMSYTFTFLKLRFELRFPSIANFGSLPAVWTVLFGESDLFFDR